jgi:hypothetical protein
VDFVHRCLDKVIFNQFSSEISCQSFEISDSLGAKPLDTFANLWICLFSSHGSSWIQLVMQSNFSAKKPLGNVQDNLQVA